MGCLWLNEMQSIGSDDFAAYLNEAVAIANGDVPQMLHRNAFMDSGRVPETGELMYSWGYPLMLAPIYRLVGWDIARPELILYYKLPSVLCLALTAAVLVLFFRRHVSLPVAVGLAVLSTCSYSMLTECNRVQNDIAGLLFSCLSLLCTEKYAEVSQAAAGHTQRRTALRPILLWATLCAVCFFWAAQIRLNGIAVVPVCAVYLLLNLPKPEGVHPQLRRIGRLLLPMALFGALYLLSGLVLPPATSNSGDIGQITLQGVWKNMVFYYRLLKQAVSEAVPYMLHLQRLPLLLAVIGAALGLRSRKTAHLSLFMLGTVCILCLLRYEQGFRYTMHIYPLLILFAALALQTVYRFVLRRLPQGRPKAVVRRGTAVLLAAYFAVFAGITVQFGATVMAHEKTVMHTRERNIFNDDAVALYGAVRAQVPPQAVVVTNRPRAMYLNTGRLAKTFPEPYAAVPALNLPAGVPSWLVSYHERPVAVGRSLAQYQPYLDQLQLQAELRYQNNQFALYELLPDGEAAAVPD